MVDMTFYWLHRTLHTKQFYWIHKKHHEYTVPMAISGGYMHPIEQQLILMGVLLPPLLLGSHCITLWIWIFFRNWETAEEHCGYDFPWNPTRLIPFYEGAAYHDYHHSKYTGNYAAIFPIFDRLFGTVAAGYEEYMNKRREKWMSSPTLVSTDSDNSKKLS